MRKEIRLLLDKHAAGVELGNEDIRTLMFAALDTLKEFERLTLESVARVNKARNEEQYELAA